MRWSWVVAGVVVFMCGGVLTLSSCGRFLRPPLKPYTSEDGTFRVRLPANPTASVKPVRVSDDPGIAPTAEPLVIRDVRFKRLRLEFLVQAADLHPVGLERLGAEGVLDDVVTRLTGPKRLQADTITSKSFKGFPGRHLTGPDGTQRYELRAFVAHGRLYQLLWIGGAHLVESDYVHEFFDSFEILKGAPPRMATPQINTEGLVVTVQAAGGTQLELTVANPTDAPKTFCDYHTPFEGIRNNIFTVTQPDGSELEYAGMMAKRAAPGPENYHTLQPGESKSAVVDLTDGYDFPAAGSYSVRFTGNGISGLDASNDVTVSVTK